MPISVVIEPNSDDAVPAMWPSGSIASAVKFEIISPNVNMVQRRERHGERQRQRIEPREDHHTSDAAMKPTSAPCEITRMPSADDARIDEARHRHADRDRRERQREILAQPIHLREHLLCREHVGEHRADQAADDEHVASVCRLVTVSRK